MPRKSDLLTINNKSLDRRIKLSEKQREEIIEMKETISQRKCAALYGVDRRTIQFIWFPEKLEENKKRREERGGWKQYRDKDKHNASMKEHRDYKKKLHKQGLI